MAAIFKLSATVGGMVEAKLPPPRPVSPEQKKVIQAAIDGDHEAARKLLLEVARDVRIVVVRFLGVHHRDVDDWIQDSFLAFIQALPRYRGESSLSTYARRITLLRVLDNQKRDHAQKRTLDCHFGEDPEQAGTAAQQSLAAENRNRRPLIQRLLAELPPEQAEAFATRHVLGFSVVDIAKSSGVPANTVRSRLRLAKEALLRRVTSEPDYAPLLESIS